MAFVTPTDVTVGSVLTASKYNQEVVENGSIVSRGVLGLFTTSTGFVTVSNHTTFQNDGLSVSASYAANRRLRVTVGWTLFVSGGGNNINFKIRRGSTDLLSATHDSVTLAVGGGTFFTEVIVFNGPATAATETFTTQIAGSSNTAVNTFGTKFICVEDVGAA